MTSGNHIWDKKEIVEYITQGEPAPAARRTSRSGTPGVGLHHGEGGAAPRGRPQPDGPRVHAPDRLSRSARRTRSCPSCGKETPIILVDMHCEATSESQAMGWYLDGRVSAVVGTHRHVQTADERVLPRRHRLHHRPRHDGPDGRRDRRRPRHDPPAVPQPDAGALRAGEGPGRAPRRRHHRRPGHRAAPRTSGASASRRDPDGKPVAEQVLAEVQGGRRPAARPPAASRRRSPSCSSATIRASQVYVRQQEDARPTPSASPPTTTSIREGLGAGRAARAAATGSAPIPPSTASCSSCRCPRASTRTRPWPPSRPRRTSTGCTRRTSASCSPASPTVVPCTPAGCLEILDHYGAEARRAPRPSWSGARASSASRWPSCCSRATRRSRCATRARATSPCTRAAPTSLCVAAGRPRMITGDMVKEGAWVIDVGVNRLPTGKLAGDVDFDSRQHARARASRPCPGGVGPMTIAMLLKNTLAAARERSDPPRSRRGRARDRLTRSRAFSRSPSCRAARGRAGGAVSGGVGRGRDLELQGLRLRARVLHAQGRRGADALRAVPQPGAAHPLRARRRPARARLRRHRGVRRSAASTQLVVELLEPRGLGALQLGLRAAQGAAGGARGCSTPAASARCRASRARSAS